MVGEVVREQRLAGLEVHRHPEDPRARRRVEHRGDGLRARRRDRAGREAGEPVQVVRAVGLLVGVGQGRAGLAEAVRERRVDVQAHLAAQSVLDGLRDLRAVLGAAALPLDERRLDEHGLAVGGLHAEAVEHRHGLGDHVRQDRRRVHRRLELVRLGEQPALDVPARLGRQTDRGRVGGRRGERLDRDGRHRGDPLVGLRGRQPLGHGHAIRHTARRVEQSGDGVGCPHLQLQLVGPWLDGRGVRVGGVRGGERADGRHHAGVREGLTDGGAGVARVHDHLGGPAPGPGVVGDDGRAVTAVEERPEDAEHGEPGTDEQQDDDRDRDAPTAAAPATQHLAVVRRAAGPVRRDDRLGRLGAEQLGHGGAAAAVG
ncbi:hypothetical protein REH70_09920 [Cellulomonas sp. ATA003]|nr:hypothetical protein [Cellulomonas sp. ATA003]WNB87373.1 hypothetical protein REH70_09920 [Cellulomonas sp. ATA003]